jgi:hypothetical protein
MARTECPPNVWTAVPDTGGDMLLKAHGGIYVCTDGSNPTEVGAAYDLEAGFSMVISAGLSVTVRPGSIRGCTVTSIAV